MKLRTWARVLDVASLKGVTVVRLTDDNLAGPTRHCLIQMAKDVAPCQIRLGCEDLRSVSDVGLSSLIALHKAVWEKGGSVVLDNAAHSVFELFRTRLASRLMED
jgi:anti-anti-sigma regulatory factor